MPQARRASRKRAVWAKSLHRAKGIRWTVGDLEFKPTPPEPCGESQLAVRHRPTLKRPIKLLVQTPVQPGRRNRNFGGKEWLTQARAERYVGHPKRAAKVVIDSLPMASARTPGCLRPECAPNFIEVKQRAKTRLSQVQHQMQELIGRAEDPGLQPTWQTAGNRPLEEPIDGNTHSLVTEPEVQLDSGPGGCERVT